MSRGIISPQKEKLLKNLQKVEQIAQASKWQRFLKKPSQYLESILFRYTTYEFTKKSKPTMAKTFFGQDMHILLPSSTDIYLTGGKSHASEIHLARFLIQTLQEGDTFIDIGAHYGYFSLLGGYITGSNGAIWSFEASPTTFNILKKNTSSHKHIYAFNHAVADSSGPVTFFEFPNLYSEYNTIDVAQFENEPWFRKFRPNKLKVESIILDEFASVYQIKPRIIKIDVEGAEFKVVSGMIQLLQTTAPIIVMEFLSRIRGNKEHLKALELLQEYKYRPYAINSHGLLSPIDDIEEYLYAQKLDSDNIVFQKQ